MHQRGDAVAREADGAPTGRAARTLARDAAMHITHDRADASERLARQLARRLHLVPASKRCRSAKCCTRLRCRATDGYPHVHEITTRWKDNDVYGHVNNVEYYCTSTR